LNQQFKNFSFIQYTGHHAGLTSPNSTLFSTSPHMYNTLNLLCYLLQRHLSHSMLSSEQRVCTQITLHHHVTLLLCLLTITVFTISLVVDSTFSKTMTNPKSIWKPSSPWLIMMSIALSQFMQVQLVYGEKCPQQPYYWLIKAVPLQVTLAFLTKKLVSIMLCLCVLGVLTSVY
jgi:hypothetical protein